MGRIADALRRAGRDGAAADPPRPGAAPPTPPAAGSTSCSPDPLPIDFDRLTQLVETLNRTTADLQEALSTIETAINALHVGVEVWVVDHPLRRPLSGLESDKQTNTYDIDELGYCAGDDGWELGVRTVRCTETSADEIIRTVVTRRPLTRCSRQQQLAAADLLPYVVERMAEQVAETIAKIAQVKQTAAAIAQVAPPPPPPKPSPSWEIL